MKPYQTSFFDESKSLAAMSRLGDPLEQLSKYVDFEIFRPVLTETFQKTNRKSPAGRKPLDVILMFKAMVIQRLFNLSDEQLEFQITDRTSFTRFLGLHTQEKEGEIQRLAPQYNRCYHGAAGRFKETPNSFTNGGIWGFSLIAVGSRPSSYSNGII